MLSQKVAPCMCWTAYHFVCMVNDRYWKGAAKHDLGAKLVSFFFFFILVLVSLASETQLTSARIAFSI